MKEVKSVKEQIETCPKDRTELIEEFEARLKVFEEYAPKMMSKEEVEAFINESFAEVIATKNKGMIMKAYVQLCLVMSQEAKEKRSISASPVQMENEKFAMRTWMNRMGMIGEEFKTAHEIYRRKLSGDAAFRYGRPE